MRNWYFPDRGLTYERTPEFVDERFGKSAVWEPSMELLANSPGEALLKFRRYVEEGRLVGAYK